MQQQQQKHLENKKEEGMVGAKNLFGMMDISCLHSKTFLHSFFRVRPGTIYREQDKYGIFGFKYGVLKSGKIKVGDPIYKITC